MTHSLSPKNSYAWPASLSAGEVCLDHFMFNDLNAIPIVLQTVRDDCIKLKNPKRILELLSQTTLHFKDISKVKQFRRDGVVCRTTNSVCDSDLLHCSRFRGHPVKTFIPHHLACAKGVVRGTDSSADATGGLHLFKELGAAEVYQCNVVVEGQRVPTELCNVTFAGIFCPSEIKVWPLVFGVHKFGRKPQQCKNCQRFGDVAINCKF